MGRGVGVGGGFLDGAVRGFDWAVRPWMIDLGCPVLDVMLDKLNLVLVAIFAVIFLHERPSVREWLGIAMVGVGVFLLGFKR